LLNTILSRVFELRRKYRSTECLEGFVRRLVLKSRFRNRGSRKAKASDPGRAMRKRERVILRSTDGRTTK
jgi:hypothetical protein